ncbi:MAG: type II secretion system secretin GspD [bacterium]
MKQIPTRHRIWPLALPALAMLLTGIDLTAPSPAQAQYRRKGQDPNGRRARPPYGGRRRNPPPKDTGGATGFKDLPGEASFNECRKYPYYKRIKVTLKPDSELHDLVAWISGMTCKRFIITGTIRAPKVTIISPTPITPNEAYRAFLSALNAMGLTVQPAGRYLKIIEIAKGASVPVMTCGPKLKCPPDERVVTQMIRLKHVQPDDVAAVLRNLTKGSIVTYGATNLLIVTDTGANIRRLGKIIKNIDVEAQDEKIWIVRIKHADADDIATKLLEVFPTAEGGKGKTGSQTRRPMPAYNRRRRQPAPKATSLVSVKGSGGGLSISKIISDERTNLLIIVADERSYLRVRALIRKLDIPVPGGEERIHIIALANADAQELAGTLAGLTGSGGAGARGRTNARGRRGRTNTRRGATNTRRGRTGRTGGRAGGAVALFQGEVQITEDQATNSLIIVASMKDYLALLKVIKTLDKPRRQLFVEATILEVALSKTRELGFAFHGGVPVGSGDNQSLILFGNNATKSIMLDPSSLMGMAVGLRGPELKNAETLLGIPGISFPSFGAFFQALQSNNDVNIISSPHILTTDNEEAEISVGENVPFQSSISGMPNLGGLGTAGTTGAAGALGGYMPFQSIQRQDVALTLKITPHINESDYVRLEIDQEINEVKSIDPVVGPTTTKRKVKTVVVVKDQQTVVIGGLITEKVKESVQKVPLLGDLPILGYLFKNTTRTIEKTNLLLFLTPYVIRDQSDLRRIFQRKIQQRKEFIERYTAFKDVDLDAVVDYRHKRGLIEEINRVGRMSEEEATMKKKAMEESKDTFVDGPVRSDPRDLQMLRRLDKEQQDELRKKREKAKEPKPEARRAAPKPRERPVKRRKP